MSHALRDVFRTFAAFGRTGDPNSMDGAKFAKLCKDTGLVSRKLSTVDVDLIFNKVKQRTERKISFEQFCDSLTLLAEKLYPELSPDAGRQAVEDRIVSHDGPALSGVTETAGDSTLERLTDVSGYTGMYAERFADAPAPPTADMARLQVSAAGGPPKPRSRPTSAETRGASGSGAAAASTNIYEPEHAEANTLLGVFQAFVSFGDRTNVTEMDNAKWVKLCRDTGLLTKKFTTTQADLIFSRVKAKGARRISFAEFQRALEAVAEAEGSSYDDVVATILAAGGPGSSGTVAEKDSTLNRLTDTSQYTGLHKERFDEQGRGRGTAGRDVGGKGSGHLPSSTLQYHGGNVSDLSQITRQGMK